MRGARRAAPSWSRCSAPPARASHRCCGPASCRGSSATGATGSCCRRSARRSSPFDELAQAGGRRARGRTATGGNWRDALRGRRSAQGAVRLRPRRARQARRQRSADPAPDRPGARSCSAPPTRRRRERFLRVLNAALDERLPFIVLHGAALGLSRAVAAGRRPRRRRSRSSRSSPCRSSACAQIIEGPARVAGLDGRGRAWSTRRCKMPRPTMRCRCWPSRCANSTTASPPAGGSRLAEYLALRR